VERELIAWSAMMSADETIAVLGDEMPPGQLRKHLKRRLSGAWTDRWWKSSPSKHTPVEDKKYIHGGHTSVHRLLIKAKKGTKQTS
jgi:hypothetical protein